MIYSKQEVIDLYTELKLRGFSNYTIDKGNKSIDYMCDNIIVLGDNYTYISISFECICWDCYIVTIDYTKNIISKDKKRMRERRIILPLLLPNKEIITISANLNENKSTLDIITNTHLLASSNVLDGYGIIAFNPKTREYIETSKPFFAGPGYSGSIKETHNLQYCNVNDLLDNKCILDKVFWLNSAEQAF